VVEDATAYQVRNPAVWLLVYFVLYLIYLFFHQEGELAHWGTLVLIPLLGLWYARRRSDPEFRAKATLKEVGLFWPLPRQGMAIAVVLVLALQIVQLMNRHQRAALDPILSSSHAVWLVPTAFLLIMVTAAFTEEVFFRGLIQRSVTERTGSNTVGVLVATIAFSLYHVPYAYLNPAWPSAGDLGHAVQLAFANGVPGGVIIGLLFIRSRHNLTAPILVHAAVDWIPATIAIAEAWLPSLQGSG